jgi:polyphosphate kinase 2 (PPK2 family)
LTDVEERKLWPDYMKAYEAALEKTSTEWAPWHVVPANHKWYRNLVVSTAIVQALESLKMQYPKVTVDLKHLQIK